jgi:hypothetical protein
MILLLGDNMENNTTQPDAAGQAFIQTTFDLDEVEKAVIQLYRLKLINGWGGTLKLETDGEKLYISQFPSSSSWTQGLETVWSVDDYVSWDALGIGRYAVTEKGIALEEFDWQPAGTRKITAEEAEEYDVSNESLVVEDEEAFFDDLPKSEIFYDDIQQAEERLAELIE